MGFQRTLLCFLCALAQFCISPARAESQQDSEELRFLPRNQAIQQLRDSAAAYKQNLENLLTWSGRAHVTRGKTDPPDQGIVSEIEFYWSSESGTRWNWKDVAKIDMATGEKSPLDRPFEFRGMILGDVFYRYSSGGQNLSIRDVKISGARNEVHAFDPIWYLNMSKQPHSEILEAFSTFLANGHPMQVRLNEGCVEIFNVKGTAFNQYQYDLRCGGNCSLFVARDAQSPANPLGVPFSTWTSEWVEIKNLWLPKTVTWTNINQRVDFSVVDGNLVAKVTAGKTSTELQRIEFLKHQVNEPVSPEEFTIKKMGIKTGDFISNQITNSVIEYTGEEPVFPQRKNEK